MRTAVVLVFLMVTGSALCGCLRAPISPPAILSPEPLVLTVEDAGEPWGPGFFKGLSGRESVEGGMLFDFGETVTTGFQMRETLVPLSIAFIAGGGVIVDIQDMEPLSPQAYLPSFPYRYGLEVNRGYFARNGIEVGDRAQIERLPDGTARITFIRER
jgi:hypothetical protein